MRAVADRAAELAPTVLVAEDEALVALDLRGALQRAGYDVRHVVHTGEDAVAAAADDPVDVALLDIRMPGLLDGLDAGWELSRKHGIPVIYVTAHNDETVLARAKDTAPYGFLVKPVDKRELRTTIELALYRHQVDGLAREGTDRYMRFFQESPAAQFVCTRDGSILECNGMFAGMLGFGTVEAAREYAILPAELTVPETSGTMGKLEADGIVEARPLNLTHRDGGLVRVMASGRIFSVRFGRVTEVHWTAIPIPPG